MYLGHPQHSSTTIDVLLTSQSHCVVVGDSNRILDKSVGPERADMLSMLYGHVKAILGESDMSDKFPLLIRTPHSFLHPHPCKRIQNLPSIHPGPTHPHLPCCLTAPSLPLAHPRPLRHPHCTRRSLSHHLAHPCLSSILVPSHAPALLLHECTHTRTCMLSPSHTSMPSCFPSHQFVYFFSLYVLASNMSRESGPVGCMIQSEFNICGCGVVESEIKKSAHDQLSQVVFFRLVYFSTNFETH